MPDFVSAVGWSSHILSILWTGPVVQVWYCWIHQRRTSVKPLHFDRWWGRSSERHWAPAPLEWVNGLLQRYKFDSPVRVGTCVVSVMALCIHQEEERFLRLAS